MQQGSETPSGKKESEDDFFKRQAEMYDDKFMADKADQSNGQPKVEKNNKDETEAADETEASEDGPQKEEEVCINE